MIQNKETQNKETPNRENKETEKKQKRRPQSGGRRARRERPVKKAEMTELKRQTQESQTQGSQAQEGQTQEGQTQENQNRENREENMVKVIGVRFKTAGKVYYFDPGDFELKAGDNVIVETARGMEFGTVTMEPTMVSEDSIVAPLKKIVREACEEDYKQHQENVRKKEKAMALCQEKIDKHGLVMKLIDVEYTFDKSKVIFYFTADGRVDFRELVKDLAGVFKMRIELRQIGVRDEAKMMGGIGSCGRSLCCHSWLSDFEPVSIKMAKVQNLSLNPAKISGICGRLMCCLKYENDIYMQLRRGMPDIGEKVRTPDGLGKVVETVLLENKVRVRLYIDDTPQDSARKRSGKNAKNEKNEKDDKNAKQQEEQEEKLTPDLYTYKKEEIRRIEKRRERKENTNIFDGMDAATKKEMEELMKDE